MKTLIHIFFTLLLFVTFDGISATEGTDDPKKAVKTVRENGAVKTGDAVDKTEEYSANEKKSEEIDGLKESDSSPTNYNSSCKFNFLFYFIYKMKYDEKQELSDTEFLFEF